MALVEQLEYGRWYVMCSLLPCGTDIMQLCICKVYACLAVTFFGRMTGIFYVLLR